MEPPEVDDQTAEHADRTIRCSLIEFDGDASL